MMRDEFVLDKKEQKMGNPRLKIFFTFLGLAILIAQIVTILMLTGVITMHEAKTIEKVGCEEGPPYTEENNESKDEAISVKRDFYGRTPGGEDVYKYTFVNKQSVQMEVITLGGRFTSIKVPDKNDKLEDVTLGYGSPRDVLATGSAYFGALVGRVANRIDRGRFTLDGVTYQLEQNNGNHHLHGGSKGWSQAVWSDELQDGMLILTHTSPEGDMNYPGEVRVKVTFQLTNDNEIIINYTARAYKKATPINLTSHPYFNLGGESNNTIYDHVVSINADQYLEADLELIPTGEIISVNGTSFDLRDPIELGGVMHGVMGGPKVGFDHTFCLKGTTGKRFAARVYHPESGRVMDVFTNQPGLQFYTGNFLDVSNGKNGHYYEQHTGFCMETQNYPDAINHENFPDSVLRPDGSVYQHQVWYQFYTM